jgi:hypothetical protein
MQLTHDEGTYASVCTCCQCTNGVSGTVHEALYAQQAQLTKELDGKGFTGNESVIRSNVKDEEVRDYIMAWRVQMVMWVLRVLRVWLQGPRNGQEFVSSWPTSLQRPLEVALQAPGT